MLIGAICFTLAPLIYVISRGMPMLLLGRVVQGIGLAMFSTAFQALVSDLAPEGRRGEALGLAGASVSIAFIGGPLAGEWLATDLGYTPFFQINAATAALSVLLVMLIAAPAKRSTLPVGSNQSDGPLLGLRLAMAQKGIQASVLTMAALGVPFGAFITFLPLFADEKKLSGAGVVFSVYAGTLLLAQPVAGWLSDRLGRHWVILPGLAVNSLATVVLALGGSVWVFVLSGVIFGIGGGLVRGGVDALVQDSVPPSLRGTAAAVQYTSFDFWIGLGSYPIGLFANVVGYATTYIATGVACLLGDVGLALMLRDTKDVPDRISSAEKKEFVR
jgi:MFS family permease